jgi:uroporphyrinogen decarboxylase
MSLMESDSVPEIIPAAFFLHFDPAYHRGDAAVARHLEYFRRTDMDFVKIQYEHSFPHLSFLQRPQDWARMPFYDLSFYEEPLYVVRGLVREAKPEALVILTLYSPFMLAGQAAGSQEKVVEHLQEDPEAVRKGLEIITESLRGVCPGLYPGRAGWFLHLHPGGRGGAVHRPAALRDLCAPLRPDSHGRNQPCLSL